MYTMLLFTSIYKTLKQSFFFLFIQLSMAVDGPITQKQKIYLYFLKPATVCILGQAL